MATDYDFKFIPETDDMYIVTNDGRVFSFNKGGKWLKPQVGTDGYNTVNINNKKRVIIHRLVADAFVTGKSDEKTMVDHMDRNKLNNHYKNLRWVSRGENSRNISKKGCKQYITGSKRKKPWLFSICLISSKKISKYFATEAERDLWAEEMIALREANIQKEIMESKRQ